MKKLICTFMMAFTLVAMTACGGGSDSSGDQGGGQDGAQSSETETAVFYFGEEGSDFYNTVTVEYSGDEILTVSDVMTESAAMYAEGNSVLTYDERVADLEAWEAESSDIKGYDVTIEITDDFLISTVTIDTSKVSVNNIFNLWAWWKTDKDYLSYEEVYEHFVDESDFSVQ